VTTELLDCEVLDPEFYGQGHKSLGLGYKIDKIDDFPGEIVRLIVDDKRQRKHLRAYRHSVVWEELQTAAALKLSGGATVKYYAMRGRPDDTAIGRVYVRSLNAFREATAPKMLHLVNTRLEQRVRILEHHLSCDRPYLQLYRLGAWSLFAAVISLLTSKLIGIGVPFHPIFAVTVIPASIAVITMAFLIKPKRETVAPRKLGSLGDWLLR